jgi:hypothetical protein
MKFWQFVNQDITLTKISYLKPDQSVVSVQIDVLILVLPHFPTNVVLAKIQTIRLTKETCLLLLLLFCSTGAWTQGLHLELLHQPYFWKGFFEIGSHGTICPIWLQTSILLISASWVARITGVSHWYLAPNCHFLKSPHFSWKHWEWGCFTSDNNTNYWLCLEFLIILY